MLEIINVSLNNVAMQLNEACEPDCGPAVGLPACGPDDCSSGNCGPDYGDCMPD